MMGGMFIAGTVWPSLGALPGGEQTGPGNIGLISGTNINKLRNFFFEKVLKEKPTNNNVPLSNEITPTRINMPNYKNNLNEALGINTRIVSNSTPFQKNKNKRIVKKNKSERI